MDEMEHIAGDITYHKFKKHAADIAAGKYEIPTGGLLLTTVHDTRTEQQRVMDHYSDRWASSNPDSRRKNPYC